MSDVERYFVDVGRDLRAARVLLERAGIDYTEEKWQPGVRAIVVPAGTDMSAVFWTGRDEPTS